MISFDEFKKVDLRVARVLEAARVEGSEKLLRLSVDAGDVDENASSKPRQIVAGIGKAYDPEKLIGKNIVIVANLEPRMLMGLESQGMVLAASDETGPAILFPERDVKGGTEIR